MFRKKEAACDVTSGPSLGRKRPRRAYAAGHAAPQQYRTAPHQKQALFFHPVEKPVPAWGSLAARPTAANTVRTRTRRQNRDLYDYLAMPTPLSHEGGV